ncbi:hypothetical protein NE237_014079 [Protea cynaroides]|uniref:Uncharacterized protein n=1 Tax=Protea cynaroides TaxID=273540 RepID=A0A9Q0H263_9MAGN|nr:hypothetical protein NE237_014079 [Protea cynaroides]
MAEIVYLSSFSNGVVLSLACSKAQALAALLTHTLLLLESDCVVVVGGAVDAGHQCYWRGKGYGRGAGLEYKSNALILWDSEDFLQLGAKSEGIRRSIVPQQVSLMAPLVPSQPLAGGGTQPFMSFATGSSDMVMSRYEPVSRQVRFDAR